ncbi:MAG: hypothetical protein ACFFCQ_07045 [Promethearchaeota archaeon]
MSENDTGVASQSQEEKLFWQIFLLFFSDSGPTIIDWHSIREFTDDLDVLAGLIQMRTVGAVKDETEVFGSLCGPDTFPSGGRAVWFSWLIENQFSTDQRILEHGAQTTLICVYDPKHNQIINKSREVIEEVMQQISSQFSKIEEAILRIQQLQNTEITEEHYKQILATKGSGELTRQVDTVLTEKILQHWKGVVSYEAFEKLPTPQKLQTIVTDHIKSYRKTAAIILRKMVFKEGTPDEITTRSQQKIYWQSVMKTLNDLVQTELALETKQGEETEEDAMNVYTLLTTKKIWKKLPLIELNDVRITEQDIANFFFWYWLVTRGLSKEKRFSTLFHRLTLMQSPKKQ